MQVLASAVRGNQAVQMSAVEAGALRHFVDASVKGDVRVRLTGTKGLACVGPAPWFYHYVLIIRPKLPALTRR
jgi:hypothetical protein